MGNIFKRILNGDITDPLTQKVTIYVSSYLLSFVLSSVPYIGAFADPNTTTLIGRAFADCLLPATVTLIASTAIENVARSQVSGVTLRAPTIWAVILTVCYSLVYVNLRQLQLSWVPLAATIASLLISLISLYSALQIQSETNSTSTNGT